MQSMLEVKDLRVWYKSVLGDYRSVDGVTFQVRRNEIFGVAGESGCGKSTLVEGVLNLVKPPGYVKSGSVIFKDKDILKLEGEELRDLRWKKLSYIPQGSMNSLNPVLKIEEQMVETILAHADLSKKEATDIALSSLRESLPIEVADMYPHELSGGMKQRVIISMSTMLKPEVVVADEPVTALDVIVQKMILQSIARLKDEQHATVILVAHDMAVHAEIVDRLAIMYAGKIMEIGSVREIFKNPFHPYTKGLMIAIPSIGKKIVKSIPGLSPSPLNWPQGCRFHTRCRLAENACREKQPSLVEISPDHFVACQKCDR